MFPYYIWLVVFHPVWLTILFVIGLAWLLVRTGLWKRYRYRIFLVPLALYAIDAALSIPRVLFSYMLADRPVIANTVPVPGRLVLVNLQCSGICHQWLMSGALDDVILVRTGPYRRKGSSAAVRYRPGWSVPGACPHERQRAIPGRREELLQEGFCPRIEPVDLPTEGIFVIRETEFVTPSQRARSFDPKYLVRKPPGRVIRYTGFEVQDRTSPDIKVLASAYYYEAPGFLGVPPLIGCWDRPDNIIWIIPPGDTGCGLWRWFTWGGDKRASFELDRVFTPPTRAFAPPNKPELTSPTPAEALEIVEHLPSRQSLDGYLPRLSEALLAPENTDKTLANLIVRRARRGSLDGLLIALLAVKRPSVLDHVPSDLNPAPSYFADSDAVLSAMEENPKLRDTFADTIFSSLAANWSQFENVDRFLTLMERNNPGWLCSQLHRLVGPSGILKAREERVMKNGERMPRFVPLVVENTARQCPDATADVIRYLLASKSASRREAAAKLAMDSAPHLAPQLTVQAVVSLLADLDSYGRPYRNDEGRKYYYRSVHQKLLRAAGQSCNSIAEGLDDYIAQEAARGVSPPSKLRESLKPIRKGHSYVPCRSESAD